MDYKNSEAVSGGDRNGFQNHLIAGGNQKDFLFENIINTEKLQSDLTNHLAQHRTVRKLVRCFGCNQGKAPFKMAIGSPVCRECIAGLKGKGKTARSNFVERVKANIGRFLRGAIAL